MTQQSTWVATLAPVDEPSTTGHAIDPKCVITVRDGAPLIAPDGSPIGRITGASIIDGHLVVTGTLDPGQDIPNALPTFESGANDRRTFGPVDSDDPRPGTVTFHTMEINAVRTGYEPAWSDPEIMFSAGWCAPSEPIHDLYEIAEREFTSFRTEADVTDELLDVVRSVVECHYQPGIGAMNMVDVADRIENHVLDNGTYPDLGDDMTSPAMERIADFALRVRRDLMGF